MLLKLAPFAVLLLLAAPPATADIGIPPVDNLWWGFSAPCDATTYWFGIYGLVRVDDVHVDEDGNAHYQVTNYALEFHWHTHCVGGQKVPTVIVTEYDRSSSGNCPTCSPPSLP